MEIDLVPIQSELNTPTVIAKQCDCYEVVGWITGKRVPLSLGHVCLPTRVNLENLLEVLNAKI